MKSIGFIELVTGFTYTLATDGSPWRQVVFPIRTVPEHYIGAPCRPVKACHGRCSSEYRVRGGACRGWTGFDSELDAELFPDRIHVLYYRVAHADRAAPLARGLAGPLAGRVETHLRPEPGDR